ncbi:hypothetical protein EV360DRAFT_88079 [Lentinula raphanica]|nr:hypothetical protein EV360DRAFT_88079 [Lentinula raphanica]
MARPSTGLRYVGVQKRKRKSASEQSQKVTHVAQACVSESSSDKENDALKNEVARQKEYQKRLYNERKKLKTWHEKYETVVEEKELQEKQLEVEIQRAKGLETEMEKLQESMEQLFAEKTKYQQQNHTLKAKIRWIPKHLATVEAKTVKLKIKVHNTKTVTMKEKALHNVPVSQCIDAFKCITTGLGFEIDGNILTRSVNWIMKEGDIAAKVHIIESFQKVEGIALSSNVDSDGRRRKFFLGISMAANHTSETQCDGWIELVDERYKLFLASPFHNKEQDKKLFKLLHDFKQRLERERHGEQILLQMESLNLVPLLFCILQKAIDRAGGIPAWERLSETEQKSLHQEMYLQAVTEIGEADFEKLSPEEKGSVDLFLWAGCCMQKDMNAFKGAVTVMEAWWGENGVDPPVLLPNCDNDAAASLAPGTAATKQTTEKSKGGGVKVSTLAGAVFRHKDRKRGQQDTLYFCFDKELGFSIEFPDTNNTRFQSHAQACAVLITYLDFFLSFLDLVEDNKSSCSLNHMEENV